MAYKILIYFLIFTAASVTAYALLPGKYKKFAFLVPSAVLYGFFCRWVALFLPLTVVTSYFSARGMDRIASRFPTEGLSREEKKAQKEKIKVRKRLLLAAFLFVNLGALAVLKYFGFFASSVTGALSLLGLSVEAPVLHIALPLGISYYTLIAIGYVTDVLRGKYPAEKNFWNLAAFLTFFPVLNEGPFGRYDKLMPQMTAGLPLNATNVFRGTAQILVGLCKLFVIADRAAILTSAVFAEGAHNTGFSVLLGTLAFTLQLYADFSGYIDIASGVAMLFNITLEKNFDLPFLSKNVGEFWRRWHISLGGWFRDYLFYPVSTAKPLKKLFSKLSPAATAKAMITVSTLAVWFLTGLWHGASGKYIVYGLYYCALMLLFNRLSPAVSRFLEKRNIAEDNKLLSALRIGKTFLLVQIGMLLFRTDNLTVFGEMFASVFRFSEYRVLLPAIELPDFLLLLLSLAVLTVCGILSARGFDFPGRFDRLTSFQKYWICFGIAVITIIFGAYGLGYLPPDPIYGGF